MRAGSEILALSVFLNQTRVGTITRLPQKGDLTVFAFDDRYLSNPKRPTLSLGFKGKTGGIYYIPRAFNARVHPFFANLLPEGRLREYIAQRNAVSVTRDFPLLLMLGEDLPGAVVIRPETAHDVPNDISQTTGVSPLSDLAPLKFSLAGIQLKFSVVRETTGGLTIPANGRGGFWLIKLPSEKFDAVPENEFAMMRVAARAGLEVPPTDLVSLASIDGLPPGMRRTGYAFAIQRFDRDKDRGRIHIEDFAQVFRLYPHEKYGKASYGNIAEVIMAELGPKGLREFIARLVFNAAIGNGDMHLKNWSLLYRDTIQPQLAPAYDYLSTLTYVSGNESMGLGMVGTRSFQSFSRTLLERFAKKYRLPGDQVVGVASEAAERTLDAWADLRGELGIPGYMQQAIEDHMGSIPLLQSKFGPSVGRRPR